jgi:hypothetical protein
MSILQRQKRERASVILRRPAHLEIAVVLVVWPLLQPVGDRRAALLGVIDLLQPMSTSPHDSLSK